MSIFTGKYLEVRNRFSSWLDITPANVTNPYLDYINRGQRKLWMYRDWKALIPPPVALTVTDKVASVPADFGKLRRVFTDTDSDLIPDKMYYQRDRMPGNSYWFYDDFDKGTGHEHKIQFSKDPQSTVYLEYVKILDPFTATDSETNPADEYSFFPPELLLMAAQTEHTSNYRSRQAEYKPLRDMYEKELRAFTSVHAARGVNPNRYLRDSMGKMIWTSHATMDGTHGDAIRNSGYPSDRLI
jgi:hypothetical protein